MDERGKTPDFGARPSGIGHPKSSALQASLPRWEVLSWLGRQDSQPEIIRRKSLISLACGNPPHTQLVHSVGTLRKGLFDKRRGRSVCRFGAISADFTLCGPAR